MARREHGWVWGIVLITLSGVLTLLVTRLWGQLGGVGVDSTAGQGGFELPLPIDAGDLRQIGVAIFLVLVVQSALSFIRIWLFGEITTRMLKALREDAFAGMITQPMAFFDTRRVGDLGSRIAADIEAIRDTFTVVLAELVRQTIIIGGGLLALMTFSWKLTLLMLGTLPVAMIAAMGFGRFIRKLSKKTQDAVAGSNTIVSETLTGIVSVKAFAREAFELARYRDRVEEVRGIALRTALWRGAFASFIIVMIFGAITIVLFQGASMLKSGDLNSEQFFSFLLMTGLVAGSIGGIANIFMATFCCALSVRLLQQRKENEDRVEAMEGAFAAERESLRAEIDALKGRGWFGSRAAEKPKPARRGTRAGGEGDAAAPPYVSAADKKAAAKGGIFV